jgi:hypothetical protein
MSNSKTDHVTKDDVLIIIENYRKHGRDTTELENFLQDAFSHNSSNAIVSVNQVIIWLKKNSPVTQGTCSLCGVEGRLLNGVCETCFLPWATKVAQDNVARVKKNRQREKL